jgi:hypothetical protein
MIIRDLLNMKGGALFSIAPEGRMADAVGMMARHDIGSLVMIKRYIKNRPETDAAAK